MGRKQNESEAYGKAGVRGPGSEGGGRALQPWRLRLDPDRGTGVLGV